MTKGLPIVLLILRLYVGWQWLHAGIEKIQNPAWVGEKAGAAIQGFLMGALKKPIPDFYTQFIHNLALPHSLIFSYLVSFGELAVGLGLILGILVRPAALGGAFMNINYLLAGTVSSNPLLLILEIPLILYSKPAQKIGLKSLVR